MFYGLSANRVADEVATQLVQAEVLIYAQPALLAAGFSYTAILAFAGVGGKVFVTPSKALSQEPAKALLNPPIIFFSAVIGNGNDKIFNFHLNYPLN
jgi:hypothetical protein